MSICIDFLKKQKGKFYANESKILCYVRICYGINKMVGTVPKCDRCIRSEGQMREGWMTPEGTNSEGRMPKGWVVLEVCATTLKDECEKVWTSKGRV